MGPARGRDFRPLKAHRSRLRPERAVRGARARQEVRARGKARAPGARLSRSQSHTGNRLDEVVGTGRGEVPPERSRAFGGTKPSSDPDDRDHLSPSGPGSDRSAERNRATPPQHGRKRSPASFPRAVDARFADLRNRHDAGRASTGPAGQQRYGVRHALSRGRPLTGASPQRCGESDSNSRGDNGTRQTPAP